MNGAYKARNNLILYGTQTGTAEDLAEQLSRDLDENGLSHSMENMFDITLESIRPFQRVFVIVSTWGDGEPPDDAEDLYEKLKQSGECDFEGIEFAVFGLGDTGYDLFCQCGIDFDHFLGRSGGKRILPLVKADLEYDELFDRWSKNLLVSLSSGATI